MGIRLTHKPGDYLDQSSRQYVIEALLCCGGMGTVYKATDCFSGAVKAIKECDMLDDPRRKQIPRAEAVEIFLNEARCIEDLKHPGIPAGSLQVVQQEDLRICTRCGNPVTTASCEICDLPQDSLYYTPSVVDRRYYIVMEFIEGQDLNTLVAAMERPLSPANIERICGWLADVATILDYVHGEGLAHCDVKPENLRVRAADGQVFLLDFGLQRVESGKTRILHKNRTILGTPGYAAPEQEQGNPRYSSDIYALCMTCAHLLTGLDPANPEHKKQLLQERVNSWLPQVTAELADLIYHGLSMDADLRPSAAACTQLLSNKQVVPPIPQTKPATASAKSPLRKVSGLLAANAKPLMVLLVVLVLAFSLWHFVNLENPAQMVTGVAGNNARIFEHPDSSSVVRRLEGGETLRLKKTGRGNQGYWFKVVAVAGTGAKGYIERRDFQMDKPRDVAP